MSDTARAYADRQFPNDPRRAAIFARGLTILENTKRGAAVAQALEQANMPLVIKDIPFGMGAQYVPPFTASNIRESVANLVSGKPLPQSIEISPAEASNPLVVAAVLAHEGEHYRASSEPLFGLGSRVGSALAGAAAMMISLGTVGMVDMAGNVHPPGVGAIASIYQGSMLVSSMTQENRAYRVGDDVIAELTGIKQGFIYDEHGNERSLLDGGWQIAREYMKATSDTVAGREMPLPTPQGIALGLAAGIGMSVLTRVVATKVLHIPARWAGYATMAPGAIATAIAGWNLVQGGKAFLPSEPKIKARPVDPRDQAEPETGPLARAS